MRSKRSLRMLRSICGRKESLSLDPGLKVVLPPLWPVFSFSWITDGDDSEIKARIFLFCDHEGSLKRRGGGLNRLKVRKRKWLTEKAITAFSTHSQFATGKRTSKRTLTTKPCQPLPWVNMSQPSFPLKIDSYEELPAIVLVAIYGLSQARKIIEPMIPQRRTKGGMDLMSHFPELVRRVRSN